MNNMYSPPAPPNHDAGTILYVIVLFIFMIVTVIRGKKNAKHAEQKKQATQTKRPASTQKPHPAKPQSFERTQPHVQSTQAPRIKPRVQTEKYRPESTHAGHQAKPNYWEPFNPPAPEIGVEGSDVCHDYMLDDHSMDSSPSSESVALTPEAQNVVRGIIWSQILERKE